LKFENRVEFEKAPTPLSLWIQKGPDIRKFIRGFSTIINLIWKRIALKCRRCVKID